MTKGKIIIKPAIAQYFGTEVFLKKTPPNIITTPQIADNIIALITPQPLKGLLVYNICNSLLSVIKSILTSISI